MCNWDIPKWVQCSCNGIIEQRGTVTSITPKCHQRHCLDPAIIPRVLNCWSPLGAFSHAIATFHPTIYALQIVPFLSLSCYSHSECSQTDCNPFLHILLKNLLNHFRMHFSCFFPAVHAQMFKLATQIADCLENGLIQARLATEVVIQSAKMFWQRDELICVLSLSPSQTIQQLKCKKGIQSGQILYGFSLEELEQSS